MNRTRILLVSFLLLLALLYVLSINQVVSGQGTVLSISSFDQVTLITLEGFEEELVLFHEDSLAVNVGDSISFKAVRGMYQGRPQLEVRKLFISLGFVLKEYSFKLSNIFLC